MNERAITQEMEGISGRPEVLALRDLLEQGYRITPVTHTVIHDHDNGPHPVSYVKSFRVSGGPHRLEGALRVAVQLHRQELLAAACVLEPPVPWVRHVVARALDGRAIEVRRTRWSKTGKTKTSIKAPYPITVRMLAAQIVGFMELSPVHDGPRFEPVIREALSYYNTEEGKHEQS